MQEIINPPKQVKARKQHICNFCGQPINKGDFYNRIVFKIDGIDIFKSHIRCEAIAYRLDMYEDCDEGLSDQDFSEFIKEAYSELTGERKDAPGFPEQLKYVCDYYLN